MAFKVYKERGAWGYNMGALERAWDGRGGDGCGGNMS